MFLGFDPVALEHADLSVASLHRHGDRRRRAETGLQDSCVLGPAVIPRRPLLGPLDPVLSRLALVVFLGGRDIVAVVIVHHPGVVQRRLLIAVVAGLSRVQHAAVRRQPVDRVGLRRSRTDVLQRQVAGSYVRVSRTRARTGCNRSTTERPSRLTIHSVDLSI